MTREQKLVVFPAIAIIVALGLAAFVGYVFPSGSSPYSTTVQIPNPVQLSVSGSGWNFTAGIGSSSVEVGYPIQLMASLTNVSPSNQTITPFVGPYINPSIWSSNGTEIWAWNPLQITEPNLTLASGRGLSAKVSIPTSQLISGQIYLVKVIPLSPQFLSPVNFLLTFQIFTQ